MRILSTRRFTSLAIAALALNTLPLWTVNSSAQESKKAASTVAIQGTPKVDGEIEDAWKDATEVDVKKVVKSETTMPEADLATGKVKILWDNDNLYLLWQVKDGKLSAGSSDAYAQDSIEVFVDELNQHAGSYQEDDGQYRVSYEGKISGDGPAYKSENVKAVAKKIEGGYLVEMSIKLKHAKREAGSKLGLELQINDDPGTGSRGGISKWNYPENDSYMSTSDFGVLTLQAK